MAVGVPFVVASDGFNHNNGVAGQATTAAVPVGALIVAAVNNPAAAALTTFHDSGGVNVYKPAIVNTVGRDAEWWYCNNAAILPVGSQFTGVSNGTQWSAAVYAVTGASAGVDQTAQASVSSSGAMTMNTTSLVASGDIGFAVLNAGTANIITDSNWTTLSTGFTAYLVSGSTTGLTNSLTVNLGSNVAGAIATFIAGTYISAGAGEADGTGAAPSIGAAAAAGVGTVTAAGAATAFGVGAVPALASDR